MNATYRIEKKRTLTPEIGQIWVNAPHIAKKAKAGQFIILRVDENGERIPLTVNATRDHMVSVVYQKIGASTLALDKLNEGDCLKDFAGPMGEPTHVEGFKRVAVVGGGVGCAIALPVAKAFKDAGTSVDLISGFRTKDIVILEDEMVDASEQLHLCTDDGTAGYHGFVTAKLDELVSSGVQYDQVFAIGPLMMMKFTCELTKKYNIPTMVSMNPIMIDGTGMCGCCRVHVGGEVKFACVEGPDFDGHAVDFDEVIARNDTYKTFEAAQKEATICNLTGGTCHA